MQKHKFGACTKVVFFDAPDVFLVQQYIASFLTFSSLVRESRWYGFVEHFFER